MFFHFSNKITVPGRSRSFEEHKHFVAWFGRRGFGDFRGFGGKLGFGSRLEFDPHQKFERLILLDRGFQPAEQIARRTIGRQSRSAQERENRAEPMLRRSQGQHDVLLLELDRMEVHWDLPA